MTRQRLVIANWKMNGSLAANAAWASGFSKLAAPACEVVVCAPFVYLDALREPLEACGAALGAENVSEYEDGAYTGEVSARMLRDVGCRWVIVGHSERRALFGETNTVVAAKTRAALEAGLRPVICVGETLEERESSQTLRVVEEQLGAVIAEIGIERLSKCVLAYEPVWAIGTGKSATPEIAQHVHAALREAVSRFDPAVARELRILYGGSVKPANAAALFAAPDIDGGLIGGAALKYEDFYAICTAA